MVWIQEEQNYISYGNFVGATFSTVNFKIDSIPPTITVSSPSTATYNTSDENLNFSANKPRCTFSYSLDGQANVSATENQTLTGLSNGAHSIIVYAVDEVGNIGAAQTINFTVATPSTSQQEAQKIELPAVLTGVGVSALIVIALIVIHQKRVDAKPHN